MAVRMRFFLRWKRSGKEALFFQNGTIKEESDLKDGVLQGASISYHLGGAVRQIATYHEGHLEGELTLFYSNGAREATFHYLQGILSGPFVTYYSDGVKKKRDAMIKGACREAGRPFILMVQELLLFVIKMASL